MNQLYKYKSGDISTLGGGILIPILGNLFGGIFLFFILSTTGTNLRENLLLLPLLGFVMFWIAGWNWQTFSRMLCSADIEMSECDIILHLADKRRLTIGQTTLYNLTVIEHIEPIFRVSFFGLSKDFGERMRIYFVSSPGLPWYLSFVGRFVDPAFRGRGFFITTKHSNYEDFLDHLNARMDREIADV